MRIFITGIAGMIGFYSAKMFAEQGYEVVGYDNFNDYYEVELKRERQRILHEYDNVRVLEKDIVDIDLETFTRHKPDVILHLAAYANPRHALADPYPYIDTNITGTQRLIEAAEVHDIPVVYASSSCVMHGQPLPWNETDRPGHQNNPYGWSKRANECQFMHSTLSRTIGLRFFTVYGPYGRPDMALFHFTKSIIDGTPIKLYNYGDMKRDFTYVEDIVQGIGLVIDSIEHEEGPYDEIFNIGYGEQVNILDFVDEIEKNLGKEAIRELVPKHPADVPETWSDTTKLQKLGYKPTTSTKDGIKKFVDWYCDYYEVKR